MYDVVKNDPQYNKRNYKATASHIQNMMNNQNSNDYASYNKNEEDEDS